MNPKRHRQIPGLPKKLARAARKGNRKWVAEKKHAESSSLCWPGLQREGFTQLLDHLKKKVTDSGDPTKFPNFKEKFLQVFRKKSSLLK